MLKKLMLTTALTGALIGSAYAQSTPSPSTSPAPSTSVAPATNASGSASFVASQKSDQWLASKFKGTDVIGTDDAKIGDVSDILFDKNGKIEAYVVGVGGFLGIGSKDVALAPSAFTVVPADANNSYDRLRLSMTKDQLKQAANFEPYNAPNRTTTGAATPGGMAPATTPRTPGTTPSTNR